MRRYAYYKHGILHPYSRTVPGAYKKAFGEITEGEQASFHDVYIISAPVREYLDVVGEGNTKAVKVDLMIPTPSELDLFEPQLQEVLEYQGYEV